ncbi:type IV secretory system conjugative DNA transfer family protein [Flavobacterium sp.]|uniref:type IV secretory system conjugative DNA transfer family protein n=1 Tax=Flavobacterium sp. TaxID=239 RepID=UPI00403343D8
MYDPHQRITHIGETTWRGQHKKFGIYEGDKFQHMLLLGKTGMGKTHLLQGMAVSDIQMGQGLVYLDPAGDSARYLMEHIPEHRKGDVIYFNPSDPDFFVAYNPLENIPSAYHHITTAGLIGVFKRIFKDTWGTRQEHVMRYALLTLLACDGVTLLDLQSLLTNYSYRSELLATFVREPYLLDFWEQEFDTLSKSAQRDLIAPILNKIGIFRASRPLRTVFGQQESDFRIQEVMDGRKVFIADLSKGKLGEDAAMILGSFLLTAFMNGAQFRAHYPEESRVPFFIYADEMHNFLSPAIAEILSECRKFRLGLIMATQHLGNIPDELQDAIFGNIGTLLCFRIGSTDSRRLAQEFAPVFDARDLLHLRQYHFYIKLCIDGITSTAFSGRTVA